MTDFGGEMVRHSVDVMALGPKLESISQLMFFEGEKNSVPVEVCGTSVPEVCEVLDVVLCAVLDVVDADVVVVAAEVVVVDELDGDGLLEQAASASGAGRQDQQADRPFPQRNVHRTSLRRGRRSGSGLSLRGQASTARAGPRPTVRKRHPRGRRNGGSS